MNKQRWALVIAAIVIAILLWLMRGDLKTAILKWANEGDSQVTQTQSTHADNLVEPVVDFQAPDGNLTTADIKKACTEGVKNYLTSDEKLQVWLKKLLEAGSVNKPAKPQSGNKSCASQEADIKILRDQRNTCRAERDACLEGENKALEAKDREISRLRLEIDRNFKIISDFANNKVPPAKQQEIRSQYSCPEGTGKLWVRTDDENPMKRIFFSNDPDKKWRRADNSSDFKDLIIDRCWDIKNPFILIVEMAEGDFVNGNSEEDEDEEGSGPALAVPLNVSVMYRSISHEVADEDILPEPITIQGVDYWAVRIQFNKQ